MSHAPRSPRRPLRRVTPRPEKARPVTPRPAALAGARRAAAAAILALLCAACGAEGQDRTAPPSPRPDAPEISVTCGPVISGASPHSLADRGVALVFVEATAARWGELSPRPVTLELVEIDTGARARLGCAEIRAGRTLAYGLVPSGRWRPAAVAPLSGGPGAVGELAGEASGAEDELRLGAGEAMHLGRAAWTFRSGSGGPSLRADVADGEARADARRIAPGMAPALLLRALLSSG